LVTAYRLATYATPLRTVAARQAARYHTKDDSSPTQYLCLHPLGPFAEFLRAHDLQRADQMAQISQRVWALRVDLTGVQHVGFDDAAQQGLDAGDLVADDYSACQQLASRLRRRGVRGMAVPSAALPGTRNLVLFGARVASPYLVDPVSSLDIPGSMTADRGRPPESLPARVCFAGGRHAELESWRAGREHVFEEPAWNLPAGG
jgi:RES domain-containing protein